MKAILVVKNYFAALVLGGLIDDWSVDRKVNGGGSKLFIVNKFLKIFDKVPEFFLTGELDKSVHNLANQEKHSPSLSHHVLIGIFIVIL